MTTTTPHGFILWEEGDTQPQTKYNDLVAKVNLWLGRRVLSRTTDAQPGSPTNGDSYIITGSASGAAWSAFTENYVAVYVVDAWVQYAPVGAVSVYVVDEAVERFWNGSAWAAPTAGSEFADDTFRIQDNGDPTKEIAFQASGITAGQTRTITMPDADVNLGNVATAVVDADFSGSEGFMRKTGAGAYEVIKSNLGASVDPVVGDDSADGYAIGSRWINTTGDKEFVCLDASVGAAVWTETTGAGGGGGANGVKSRFFPVTEMIYPGSQPPAALATIGSGSTSGQFKAAGFDATTSENLHFAWIAPNNYDEAEGISFIAYWAPSNTNTGTVRWELRSLDLVQGDAIDQAHVATGHFVDQAGNGTAGDLHITAESTRDDLGTITKNSLVALRIIRRTDGDDYNADAMLIGIRLFWTTDAPTED